MCEELPVRMRGLTGTNAVISRWGIRGKDT